MSGDSHPFERIRRSFADVNSEVVGASALGIALATSSGADPRRMSSGEECRVPENGSVVHRPIDPVMANGARVSIVINGADGGTGSLAGTNGSVAATGSPAGSSIISPIIRRRRRPRSDLIGGIASLASPSTSLAPSPLPPSRPGTPCSGTSSVFSAISATPSGISLGGSRSGRRVTLGVANTPNSEWYHRFQRNSLQTTSSGAPIRGDRLSQSPDSARGGSDSGLGVQQPEFGDPVTAGHGYSMDNRRNRLRDVQERVQKKTFINWINSYLAKRQTPLKIEDLFEDLKDGSKLVYLLEVLSGEKLPIEKGRLLRRPHFISNCNTALEFLRSKKVRPLTSF